MIPEGAPAPSRPRRSKRMAAGVAAVASVLLAVAGGLAYFSGHLLPAEEAVATAPVPIETGLSVAVLVFANRGYQILREEMAAMGEEMGRNAVRMFDVVEPAPSM